MGLKDLQRRVNPKLQENHCPRCGVEGEDTGRAEYRCPTPSDECEVVYWFPGGD